MLYRAPGFKDQTIPIYDQEIFNGTLVIQAPFKIPIRTLSTTEKGEEKLDVKEVSEFKIDCMQVYQYALPGQGFIIVSYERINDDRSTTLVTALFPAFNKDDENQEHRTHLEKAGIPYIEIPEPLGKNTGIGHVTACRWLGFQPEKDKETISRLGGSIFKKSKITYNSQSQNAKAILYDEFFLLAYALDIYDKENHFDKEFSLRRLAPFDISLSITNFLQSEMKLSASQTDAYADDGAWLPTSLKDFINVRDYKLMENWKDISIDEKKNLLLSTLFRAIEFNDPTNYTDRRFGKNNSYIDRILNLNKELKLNLPLNQGKYGSFLHVAVKSKNTDIVKKLLQAGLDINEIDEKGNFPLWIALQEGDYNMFSFLIQNGADKKILFQQNPIYENLITEMLLDLLKKDPFKVLTEIFQDKPDLDKKFKQLIIDKIKVRLFDSLYNPSGEIDSKKIENLINAATIGDETRQLIEMEFREHLDLNKEMGGYLLDSAIKSSDTALLSKLLRANVNIKEIDNVLLSLWEEEKFEPIAEILKGNTDFSDNLSIIDQIQLKFYETIHDESKVSDEKKSLFNLHFPEIFRQIKNFIDELIAPKDTEHFIKFVKNCISKEISPLDYKNLRKLEILMNKVEEGHINLNEIKHYSGSNALQCIFTEFTDKIEDLTSPEILQELEQFQLYCPKIFAQFIIYPPLTQLFAKTNDIPCLHFLIKNGARSEVDDTLTLREMNLTTVDFLRFAGKMGSTPSDIKPKIYEKFYGDKIESLKDFHEKYLNFKLILFLIKKLPSFTDLISDSYITNKKTEDLLEEIGTTFSENLEIGDEKEIIIKEIEAFFLLQHLKTHLLSNLSISSTEIAQKQIQLIDDAEENNDWDSTLNNVIKIAMDFKISNLSIRYNLFTPSLEPELFDYLNWFQSKETLETEINKILLSSKEETHISLPNPYDDL